MSELLSEVYQNGIYWAALNAEQARERAANAELDYWTKRAERDGLVAGMERTDGTTSAANDGIRTGKDITQAIEKPDEYLVMNLVSHLRRGIHKHKDEKWAQQASEYLERKGIRGNILRSQQSTPSQVAAPAVPESAKGETK